MINQNISFTFYCLSKTVFLKPWVAKTMWMGREGLYKLPHVKKDLRAQDLRSKEPS